MDIEHRDILSLVEILMPKSVDKEATAKQIQGDKELIEAMLDDERLFERLMTAEDLLLLVSPRLFFTVLLRRARRDLEQQAFTVEDRSQQKVLLFDTDDVIRLLYQEPVLEYLAMMLASFTRIESVTFQIRVREGIWRRYRTNDLDVEGLMRYCQAIDKSFHFEPFKRIADVCLFLAGMFPDFIDAQYRYPRSRKIRPRMKGRIFRNREDYEAHGQAFYRLAAEHERAGMHEIKDVLATLSDNFILAEKPLALLANRYLCFSRHRLFDM